MSALPETPVSIRDHVFDLDAAARLPSNIYLGTSSWTYESWRGVIYHRPYSSTRQFNAQSLGEYARFPWFRTVGVDSFFYGPPTRDRLKAYADLVPPEFRWVSKVWERLTIPRYPAHPRYGPHAGKDNPDFLNPALFVDQVLAAYDDPGVRERTGPFVLQFPTIPKAVLPPEAFLERLERFLAALPRDFRYATEIRNPELLSPEYFGVLNRTGATHCFNHWHYMPPLRVQMRCAADAGGLDADLFVARILTPLGVSYEGAVKLFSPYDAVKRPNPEMRADTVRLARRALETRKRAFIIVNNRVEGSSPVTIDIIGKMIVEQAGDT